MNIRQNKVGIDYGNGMMNIDLETGIRYGVIPAYSVLQAWADSSEPVFFPEDYEPDEEEEAIDPILFKYEEEGYIAHQQTDDPDIFVIKSPYYTKCVFCSPCAPGAGDLSYPLEDGIKTYCFGPDWFDDEKVPYPIWEVATDKKLEV